MIQKSVESTQYSGMSVILYPERKQWNELAKRPSMNLEALEEAVKSILNKVNKEGDEAIVELTEKFDGVKLQSLNVKPKTTNIELNSKLRGAIELAYSNIKKFHSIQFEKPEIIETQPGVQCWRKSVPIEKVGLYIPGGSAPLFSTLLMLGIPAQLAGCKEIVVCTPPNKDGSIDPTIAFTAQQLGIETIYLCGGAQAIAALAYGTASIPKVDKIFGPGNQYVTMAKLLVQQEGLAIDMPAGPSEVLVIADDSSVSAFVAADLLSQAEHGSDSQVILVSNSPSKVDEVIGEIDKQLDPLPRKEIAAKALSNSKAIVFDELNTCMDFSNLYAPEHLIIATESPEILAEKVTNAGSVFLGKYSCESAGDYASGTNHTLPTNGHARNYSGVSLDSFVKKITFQNLTKEGIQNIGPAIEVMAEAEQLKAHKNAVSIRLKAINDV